MQKNKLPLPKVRGIFAAEKFDLSLHSRAIQRGITAKNKRVIVMTGGHASSTAYSVIREFKKKYKNIDFYWVGASHSFEGKKSESFEKKTMPKLGVMFIPVIAGRIQRKFTIWTIPSLLRIPLGFIDAYKVIRKTKPDVVVSFGGYIGFPMIVVSKLMGIKTVIHEQTSVAGRANQASSLLADKILISRETSKKYFPKNKIVLIGNPTSYGIKKVKVKYKMNSRPVIFVTGGKSGSKTLNDTITQAGPKLLDKFDVIHQTGSYQYQEIVNFRKELNSISRKHYKIYDVISSEKWPEIFDASDIVISRSGANIVSDLLITKRPSILIPIPFTYLDEQVKNARYIESVGIAKVIMQKDLSVRSLLANIDWVVVNWKKMIYEAKDFKSPDINAASRFVDIISKYLT